jgi:membrane protein implicated in regulation of membrane protease activity
MSESIKAGLFYGVIGLIAYFVAVSLQGFDPLTVISLIINVVAIYYIFETRKKAVKDKKDREQ